ncbi:hypothetical protein AVEN_5040-1 [Araneus ventricosus]|uniref:Uncharacterized protein n=1 Tax=Araneus ventricosus TaxID=182803 RepID=A0A4Y2K524_ARAVE|nr:hypothetical protein AVEN_5040-1 [Araneus ventricosus]
MELGICGSFHSKKKRRGFGLSHSLRQWRCDLLSSWPEKEHLSFQTVPTRHYLRVSQGYTYHRLGITGIEPKAASEYKSQLCAHKAIQKSKDLQIDENQNDLVSSRFKGS